ncbi:transposase [Clostridium tagluense]|uniref:transposase n=1 Tax=Clostridium tagluense TaxID=360422 RepID=UPI0021F43FC1|nr:transposase [Clostridium tagluense]
MIQWLTFVEKMLGLHMIMIQTHIGDTQAQSLPVFTLSYLLAIKLMTSSRNWKEVNLQLETEDNAFYSHGI